MTAPLVSDPMGVLALLVALLAGLFGFARTALGERIFRVLPLLVFAYFLPTVLSNTGVIPLDGKFPLYEFVKDWLLPASLVLLVLSVDVPAIAGLGGKAVTMFLVGTLSVILGGPLAYLLLGSLVPGDQVWRGLAALSGSWIGGGANFVAVGESVGATDSTMSLMVVVDVVIANVWMAILLAFAGREKAMDEAIGADRAALDRVRHRIEAFRAEVSRPANVPDLLTMLAIAFVATWVSRLLAPLLPGGALMGTFTWVVILVTTVALGLSFTPLRRLEGAGASTVGSVLLYLLVATIGAKAEFAKVLEPENTALLLVGALWMAFHAGMMLLARRVLKAPIFFMAVGSQANIGGAASAPVVASAFHPALAPVGVLLAVAGYALGVYGGLLCAVLLRLVHGLYAG